VTGNLKFDAAFAGRPPERLARLLHGGSPRPLWVAGSTVLGEEELVLRAFHRVRERVPHARLLVAPRHPERFSEVPGVIEAAGFRCLRRSALDPASWSDGEVLLLDTLGELAQLYSLASVVFVGGSLVLVSAPALWLARINFVVALFNLLPGFPLDGGRVLRAAVWAWTGSFDRGNRAAAAAGEGLALILIGVGVLRAIGGDVAGGIWMALIGWFLQSAVAAGRAQAALRELLRGATVRQAMDRDCSSVAPDLTLERLVQEEVLGAGRRCFMVAEDGHLRGLLTLHEVKGVPRERWDRAKVEEVMQPAQALSVVGPGEDLFKALEKMDDASVAQLPVVDDGQWLGMLDREHILHYMRVRAELGV